MDEELHRYVLRLVRVEAAQLLVRAEQERETTMEREIITVQETIMEQEQIKQGRELLLLSHLISSVRIQRDVFVIM